MDNYIEELVTTSNLFELVKTTVDKIGLEILAPIEPSRCDEIISKEILAVVRS